MILTRKKKMIRILYFENIFKLTLIIFYLSFVVYLYRTNIVKFNGETQRLYKTNWSFR